MSLDQVAVVLTAAGQGTRLGSPLPKALVELAGAPLLEHALRRVRAAGIAEIVVTISAEMEPLLQQLQQRSASFAAALGAARLVRGGVERVDSVYAGIRALDPARTQVVLVHDAARAATPPQLIREVAAAVSPEFPCVVPGLPVADTIKELSDPHSGLVRRTPPRALLRAIQTPQGCLLEPFLQANAAYFASSPAARGFEATDDASLMEWAGYPVKVIPGAPAALKITHPADLELAAPWLAQLPE